MTMRSTSLGVLFETINCWRCGDDLIIDEQQCAVVSLPPTRFSEAIIVFPLCSACTRGLRQFLNKPEGEP